METFKTFHMIIPIGRSCTIAVRKDTQSIAHCTSRKKCVRDDAEATIGCVWFMEQFKTFNMIIPIARSWAIAVRKDTQSAYSGRLKSQHAIRMILESHKKFLGFLETWNKFHMITPIAWSGALAVRKKHKELRQFSYSQKFYERIIQIRWMRAKISTILDIFLQEMTLIRSAMVRHQNRTRLHLQVAFECRQPTWQPNEQNSIVSIICRGAYWGNHL